MKTFFTLLVILAFYFSTYGQKALSFSEAKIANVNVEHLDSVYRSAVHVDTTLSVFKNRDNEVGESYFEMLQKLGKFLKSRDFKWEKPTKGFNRIYFNKDGGIDYFIYSFRPDQLTPKQEKQFEQLLNEFIKDYRFPLTAEVGFAQCSPVTYRPSEE
ncbi:MAG: hypothetical protein EYC69_12300 [Bacteroidetes bacterium]|nr:MAG: hypothetical protein EYC69_12300 [Bacteroidota bacterium]